MSACETCWADAYIRARALGGSQVEHYERLLSERADDPDHAPDELLGDAVAHAEARALDSDT
jgi:hypothetical protein